MNKLVSIIMPSYNTAHLIADSIQSVLTQTYKDFELIIVDDASTDNTDAVVQPFLSDNRIKYFKNDVQKGAALSRNRALLSASGTYIAFLDSDDLWRPEKLEKQVSFMEEHGYAFSYTDYTEMDYSGKVSGMRVSGPPKVTRRAFKNYCYPGCLTVMYNKDVAGLIQIEDIKRHNDYAMWLEVSKKADCYLLNEDLALYRRGRAGSVSTQNTMELIKWFYRLHRISEKQNRVLSLCNTMRNILFGFLKKKKYVRRIA